MSILKIRNVVLREIKSLDLLVHRSRKLKRKDVSIILTDVFVAVFTLP